MKARPTPQKIVPKIIAGAVAGTILASSALPAMAKDSDFRLPVPSAKLSVRNEILSAVYDIELARQLFTSRSLPSNILNEVACMLGDEEVNSRLDLIKKLVSNYKITNDTNDLKLLLNENQKIQQFLLEKYPDGFTALRHSYLSALRNHGVMGQKAMTGLNVKNADQIGGPGSGSGGGSGIQQKSVDESMAPVDAWVGANTTAVANVFAAVNVSVWSNAVVVVLAVAVAAVVIP
jgi:hypothetical protein